GEYVLELPQHKTEGHFGLAVRDYTHSTAPNRRFPDLITQRLLKTALGEQTQPYSNATLAELASHCTQQEEQAMKVERRVQKSAAALLLEPRVGERFDAIVTGASAKGTWVRILRPAVEGKVVRGAVGLDVGDHTRVELLSTDVERGYIDFARIEE
ncbi:MAG TPA: RNB domain-containing ribonuclease, partial [Candidatus Acidoferrales bacterium]|nr:RNB domain-containing ribonuclease [Candidatus Acidoferrales bacterium]